MFESCLRSAEWSHNTVQLYSTTSTQLSYKHPTTYVELGTDRKWLKWGEELGQCCQIQNASTRVRAQQHSFSSLRYDDMQFYNSGPPLNEFLGFCYVIEHTDQRISYRLLCFLWQYTYGVRGCFSLSYALSWACKRPTVEFFRYQETGRCKPSESLQGGRKGTHPTNKGQYKSVHLSI